MNVQVEKEKGRMVKTTITHDDGTETVVNYRPQGIHEGEKEEAIAPVIVDDVAQESLENMGVQIPVEESEELVDNSKEDNA